ncbi:MAG TPA: hypothetical protein VGE76_11695, partial [Opitutaceae bacterium]
RNIGLEPYTADNFDLSAEYYTSLGGIFSAGAFRKDIVNFFGPLNRVATAEDIEAIGFADEYIGFQLTTTTNVGDAKINGTEFSFRQPLKPFGGFFRYLTVFMNGTKLKLEGNSPASFNRFLPLAFNWGINYSRRPLTLALSWNARGKQNQGVSATQGAGADLYFNPALNMSLSASYQMTPRLALFLTGTNVFNEWRTYGRYAPSTPHYARRSSTNSYGSIWSLGVRGSF